MDDYSKSGSKTYKAEARAREAARRRELVRALEQTTEATFIEALRLGLGLKPEDPSFPAALKIWRARHP